MDRCVSRARPRPGVARGLRLRRSSTRRNASTSSRRPGSTWAASSGCRASGSYFTRELKFLNTSIIIVRGKDDVIRAFHNICPHRGNKMLWEDDPFQEVQGRAPLLYCRFHGWRYNLDGSLHSATRKDLLLDFDADSCRVPAVQCEVWEGFIFINLNPHNTEPLRSFLGELAHGIEGYPFEGPHQVYNSRPNWSATGRSSSTVSPRATTARTCMPPRSVTSPRRPKRRSTNRTRSPMRWRTSSRVRTGCSRSRRAVAKDAVLQAHRMRVGGERGRPVEQADRQRADAAGNQSHARRRSTVSTPFSSSRTSC